MKIKMSFRQTVISLIVFSVVMLALISVDPRVRTHVEQVMYGGNGTRSWDNRAAEVGSAVVTALKYQSIENAPLLIFAVGGAILFLFMVRA